jgi:hypothetical protein
MKKYQVFLLVLVIASLGTVLSGCVAIVNPNPPQPPYQPTWYHIGEGVTNELKCDNLWHNSSYFVLPISVNSNEATQVTIWASVTAVYSPPSDFYVYLLDKENYNAWENGASVSAIEGADLTREPGGNFYFEVTLPKNTYYLMIWNDYQAIILNHSGKACYNVYAFY